MGSWCFEYNYKGISIITWGATNVTDSCHAMFQFCVAMYEVKLSYQIHWWSKWNLHGLRDRISTKLTKTISQAILNQASWYSRRIWNRQTDVMDLCCKSNWILYFYFLWSSNRCHPFPPPLHSLAPMLCFAGIANCKGADPHLVSIVIALLTSIVLWQLAPDEALPPDPPNRERTNCCDATRHRPLSLSVFIILW